MATSYRLYAGGYQGKIVQLEFDPNKAPADQLVVAGQFECGEAPTWLTFSQDGKMIWSADEWGKENGTLTTLRVGEDGQLVKGNTVSTGGLWPCHSSLLTSTNPPQILTSNYKGANVHCIQVDQDGQLDAGSAKVVPMDKTGSSLGPVGWRQEQAHPHGAHPDPTGTFVVVPDLGTDDLRILRVDSATGTISEDKIVHMQPGDGPRHVLFGSLRGSGNNGQETRLYIMNELDNSISVVGVVYPHADSTSALPDFKVLQQRVSLLPSKPFPHQQSFDSWHSAELVLSPCGRFLLASNRAEAHDPAAGRRDGPEDLLAVFRVDEDGLLVEASRKLVSCGGRAPRHMSFSSESIRRPYEAGAPAYLAVAVHDSDEIVIFEFSSEGELTETARIRDVGRPGIVLWA